MAFDLNNFARGTMDMNVDGPNIHMYNAGADAAVTGAGYFNGAADLLLENDLIYAVYNAGAGSDWYQVTDITAGVVTVAAYSVTIPAGSIVNADVNAAAAIAFSKLAALPSAQILVGSAGNVATAVAVTGDIAITNTGVTSIAAGAIVNADVNAAAAIAFSKLAALPSAQILVGSAGNAATAVAMSGDVAIDNTGATTIQAGAIDKAMLSTGINPSHVVKFAGQPTTVGGAAAEAFAVAGVLVTDLAFVQIVDNGTGNVTALQAVCTADTLTVTFSGNPGNDCVFNYQILRAAT